MRSKLLPPYLDDVQAWLDLADSIDEVYKVKIDDPIKFLAKLRDTWIIPDDVMEKVSQNEILDLTDYTLYEREILIKQANMLGFDFRQSDLINDEDYQRITRNLSLYWYEKGTPKFVDFMGFVLNCLMQVIYLWSEVQNTPEGPQYGPFLPEGDPGIGTPVYQPGGTWFPTTHVQVAFDPFKFASVSFDKMLALFYAIANYNLVVDSLIFDGVTFIHSHDQEEIANIVVAYPMIEIELLIYAPEGGGEYLLQDGSNLLLQDGSKLLINF
jgi:hypothetical protein